MLPILYGTERSPPVRAVLLTAKAIKLELEFKEVDLLKKDHLQPEFVKINPQHTIPTIDDNGFIVWDSHAIVAYIVGQHGKDDSLYPKDLKIRATVDQRMHFNSSIIYPHLRGIVFAIVFLGKKEIPEVHRNCILDAYGFLETFLVGLTWLAADQMTIADLCTIANISTLHNIIPIEVQMFPKVRAWMEKCKGLPYYEEANGKGSDSLGAIIKSKLSS